MSSAEPVKEVRRSPRILARISLDVQPIEESLTAVTAVINLHGALILCAVPWPAGTLVAVRNHKTNRSIQARVVWTGPDEGNGYKLGIEFEEPESGFWGSDYKLANP